MSKIFLCFLCLFLLQLPAAKKVGRYNTRKNRDIFFVIDSLVRKIKSDLITFSKKDLISGRLAIVGFDIEQGVISRSEVNYLLKNIEKISLKTPNFYFVRSVDGINNIAPTKIGIVRNVASKEISSMQSLAKKISAPYFTYFKLIKKKRIIRFIMTVYNTKTGDPIWSKVWFAPYKNRNFLIDIFAQTTLDSLYMMSFGTYAAINSMNIFNFGGKVALFYSFLDNRYNPSSHNFVGAFFGLKLEASLISSLSDNFDVMDMLLFVEFGAYIGKLIANTSYSYSPGLIQTRPSLSVGLNFLFKQQGFVYAGVDFGSLMTTEKRMPTFISPVVGFGYRF